MEENQTKMPDLDIAKAVATAKWLKADLGKSIGWTQRYHIQNEYSSWTKTFASDATPVKTLYQFENLPMSAEKFTEMMSPSNLEIRAKWDKTTALETLEKLPNGGCILHSIITLSFPFCDRDYVLYCAPPTEIDWFGRKAFAIFFQDATHPSRPAGLGGVVRATNGGNFYIAVQDEQEPGNKCETFMLTTNNYNGMIPNKNERLVARKVPKVFYQIRQYIIEGHKKHFS